MIEIYGASDDLIEVEGDIREEFNWCDSEPAYLAFSDGTVLSIQLSDDWRIRLVHAGTAALTITPTTADDDEYTDRARLDGDIRWVVCGAGHAKVERAGA